MSDQQTETAGEQKPTDTEQKAPPRERTIGQLAAALAKAQGQFTSPKKDIEVTVRMKNGGQYSFKYADLAAIWNVVRKPLSENGLAVIQPLVQRGDGVFVRTILAHEAGEVIRQELFAGNVNQDIKDLGGKITYVRRYCLSSMLGIASEDDVDSNGQAAGDGPPMNDGQPRQRPPQQPQQWKPKNDKPLPGYNYRYPRGILKCELVEGGGKPIAEYDITEMGTENLHSGLEHAKAREEHFSALGPRWKGPVLDAQLDQKKIREELDRRNADEVFDEAQKKAAESPESDSEAETGDGSTDTPDEQADPQSADDTPDETPTAGPDKPAGDGAMFGEEPGNTERPIVAERVAHLDVEIPDELADSITTVKPLDPTEMTHLSRLTPAEILGMILHPANAKLFDPALGQAIRKHTVMDPFTPAWLTAGWLPAIENSKDLKRDGRKLARLAILGAELAERGEGEPPDVPTRRASKEEHAKIVALLANLCDPDDAKKVLAARIAAGD